MKSLTEFLEEDSHPLMEKLSKVEKKAYVDTLKVAKEAIAKLLKGSGVVDKAIQLELKDWEMSDVNLEKVESEVLGTLKMAIQRIK